MSADPSRTRLAERLRQRQQPTPQELREHLLEVHRHNAGFTEACAQASRDSTGRNSYEWLVELLDGERHAHVLDLACGSGLLSALCYARQPQGLHVTAVDMSEHELHLARERLAGTGASVHQGMAQELHFLDDSSVDVVLCHWALTLMDPVEPVLGEVARVLRPGGVFAAIVDGDMRLSANYEAVHHLIYDAVSDEYPGYGEFELGDARVRGADSLHRLVSHYFDAHPVQVESNVLHLDAPPAPLARVVAGFFYAAFVLSGEAEQRMLAALEAHFAANPSAFAMPINRLVARKAQGHAANASLAAAR